MVRYFTLQYWIDEGWYVGRLKEIPGVFSQGASLQELEENIREAYRLMMEEESEALPHIGIQTKEFRGRGVKRREFVKELTAAGCYLKRSGKKQIYT